MKILPEVDVDIIITFEVKRVWNTYTDYEDWGRNAISAAAPLAANKMGRIILRETNIRSVIGVYTIQQTSSISTCILNTFAGSLLAERLLDRVNTPLYCRTPDFIFCYHWSVLT